MRFSPLTQIGPANVARLQVAWMYHIAAARSWSRTGGTVRQRNDTDRRCRRDVHLDALQPRRRAGSHDAEKKLGLPSSVGQSVDARRRVLGPATRRLPRRSSSGPPTASSTRSMRRPAAERRVRRSGRRRSEHARDFAGLPGSNGLSSPPFMYRNLIITGGRTRRIRRRGRRATSARGTSTPASSSGRSARFRAPARRSTTPGRATAGRTARA